MATQCSDMVPVSRSGGGTNRICRSTGCTRDHRANVENSPRDNRVNVDCERPDDFGLELEA